MEMNGVVERFLSWTKKSVTLKLMTLGFLLLVLLIPASMIESTIRERERTRQSAVDDVTSKWGGPQTLGGPALTVPYRVRFKDARGQAVVETKFAHFFPETLKIVGDVSTEIRYRGIYEAVLYQTSLRVAGEFAPPDFGIWNISPQDVLWGEAQVSFSLPDMRGIRDSLSLRWNGKDFLMNPGVVAPGLFPSGVSVRAPLTAGLKNIPFSLNLQLAGSRELNFFPFGKETTVNLKSPWPNPSFGGNFLPQERDVRPDGFTASWKVLNLNRNYPQQWLADGGAPSFAGSEFGVNFIMPVDQYQKTLRSTKYAVLFILLTFGAMFFIEILNGKRVNVFQYLLLGSAIVLFYSLLLSLAEHLGFGRAYLISSGATILLISLYAKGIFSSVPLMGVVGALLTFLYGYLYGLLQMEDYALLIGNVGLFAALAVSMYFSRKWDSFTPKS